MQLRDLLFSCAKTQTRGPKNSDLEPTVEYREYNTRMNELPYVTVYLRGISLIQGVKKGGGPVNLHPKHTSLSE